MSTTYSPNPVTEQAPRSVPPGHSHHAVPLWALFGALLAFTAAEVALWEVWHRSHDAGHAFMPKYAMVLVMLFVLTLPKAVIVLTYFMHLKFERQLVVLLALIPFVTAAIAVLHTLIDIRTLKADGKSLNQVESLKDYEPVELGATPAGGPHGGGAHGGGEAGAGAAYGSAAEHAPAKPAAGADDY